MSENKAIKNILGIWAITIDSSNLKGKNIEKLTAYRVYGNIIEDLHYSKVFYVDESQFDNEEEINDALEEMAREDWWESGEWEEESGDIFEGFTVYEAKKVD